MGNGSTKLDYPAGGFADSILNYETENGRQYVDYLGTGQDDPSVKAVSRFNGGKKGFYLSHVGNLYRTDNMIPATIKFKIRLGSNINNSTVIYEQFVDVQPDTTGTGIYLIAKLDSSILINAYEDFWIEWDYAFGMRFPQGFQYVTSDQFKPQTFYFKSNESDAFMEVYWTADFYMAAYAQTDSTGGWLTITPDKGNVGIGATQSLILTAQGPKTTPADQSADLIIRSNDPATPETKVGVYVHIDQAPVLSNHDTLVVHEADTLNSLIPATDDGGGIVTGTLVNPDTAIAIINTDTGSYFIYRPGYNDEGIHNFDISLADDHNNKRSEMLTVRVVNTNRPPVVIHPMESRIVSLQGAALRMGLDTVFMDPDGDKLIYAFISDSNHLVKVYVDSTGETSIIPLDTGHIDIPFLTTDSYAASAYDTLHLFIRNNAAPEATDMPNVVIDKGATRVLNLSTWFSDSDSLDVLTYTVKMDSAGFANMGVNGSELTITGLNEGNCLVTVTASDGNGGTASKSFILMVLNNKGNIVDDYHIKVAPNPIHTSANILFQLGEEKKVHIDLIGMDGKIQSVLYEGNRSAGDHSIHINFSNIAAGNYLLKFTIDDKVGVIQIAKI